MFCIDFRQPIVDTFDINICTAKSQRHVIDFGVSSYIVLPKILLFVYKSLTSYSNFSKMDKTRHIGLDMRYLFKSIFI